MPTNDVIVLDKILEHRKSEVATDMTDTDFFELFTAEQILKDYEPSYEEVEQGLVGGGNDGGIDGLYLYVNGTLVVEDTDFSYFKKDVVLSLIFVQSKTSSSFTEETMNKFLASTTDLLDLSQRLDSLASAYNADVLDKIKLLRKAYAALAGSIPRLFVSYYYATKGQIPAENVVRKAQRIEEKVTSLFSNSQVSFNFLGASNLLALAQKTPRSIYELALSDNPISTEGPGGFLAVVNLRNFFEFITGDNNQLSQRLFEANVRDYQGAVQVNKAIQHTLQEYEAEEDFWWLNNGITIIASQATHSSRLLTIENPLIVNGLQTSKEIYEYFADKDPEREDRHVLVRVIEPSSEESRDRIIKATNSQTSIPPASLRATEQIHLKIEEYLKHYGIFYDRRKNFYKNAGKPTQSIIGIPKLAQTVMAILLQRPHDARARPSSLIQNDNDYEAIFSDTLPIDTYRICVLILQQVEDFLKTQAGDLEHRHRNNLKFHILMVVTMKACGSTSPNAEALRRLDLSRLNNEFLLQCLEQTRDVFEEIGGTDQMAKSKEFTLKLIERIES